MPYTKGVKNGMPRLSSTMRPLTVLGAVVVAVVAAITFMKYIYHPPEVTELPVRLESPSLKELAARKGIELGNHAIYTRVNEPAYRDILTSQHNFVILDNTPNWHFNGYDLRPSRTAYDFWQLDYLVGYADRYSMPMRLQHLLWGEQKWLPDWLLHGGYSRSELYAIVDDHIQTIMGRYKGKIREYTVVNEAFTRQKHLYNLNDWWADATGSRDYIDRAFVTARQADPSAKLILNDFNNESKNVVSDAMYEYIASARGRGVPIDGIGMQMHIDGSHPPKKDEVIATMKRFAGLGVAVYVTEFDVNMADLKLSYSQKAKQQEAIYYDMMRACIESGVCKSFTMLGITDKETWYNYMNVPEPMPLMFDASYRPKPAYYGLRRALSE